MKKQLSVITIQGPTASGKSKFALELAEILKTEIISADSRQVYRYLNIGTAKPSRVERQKIPHHLIDIINPDQQFSAGDFCREADILIKKISNKGKIPIIAGGTGFYFKALLRGLAKIPPIPEEIKKNVKQLRDVKGDDYLHEYLQEIDPVSARRIASRDIQKIIRALEVYRHTGKKISDFWQEQKRDCPYRSFDILLTAERSILYEKINSRIDRMLSNGLLNEIENLLQMGYKEEDPGMISLGYREFYPYFKGEMNLPECIEKAKQNTRNFAKRQFTWFKKVDFDLTLTADSIIFSIIHRKIDSFIKSVHEELE
ncbi:MAG: tRNA (adenosine(37)-N6)-dimethylallyltransferase MiaA [Candidatus Cloacimonetes bacterium]|nr:tRNA (adenosine(37)-N6)-dimethylallyltransferase MiaA [Candidatus Cloacimonadota bacterium]